MRRHDILQNGTCCKNMQPNTHLNNTNAECHYSEFHNAWLSSHSVIELSFIILSNTMLSFLYTECDILECHYSEFHNAELSLHTVYI